MSNEKPTNAIAMSAEDRALIQTALERRQQVLTAIGEEHLRHASAVAALNAQAMEAGARVETLSKSIAEKLKIDLTKQRWHLDLDKGEFKIA